MDIEYKGANSVVISTKKAKIIVDPKLSIVGLNDVSTKDCIQLATEERFATNNENAVVNIEGPGEYELSDFAIRGIPVRRHIDTPDSPKLSTIYRVEASGICLGVVGNITPKLHDEQQESLGVLDLLIVPIGGNGYTLDATSAATLARTLDVKVVIPVHYNDVAIKYEVAQDELDVFVKEFGAEVLETTKYKLKSAANIPITPTIIAISRS